MAIEFLTLIETMRAEEAAGERLYDADEVSPRSIRKRKNYASLLLEATSLVQRARRSTLGKHYFQEAMKTSDFPLLMADVLDRQLYGTYMETAQTWSAYCRRSVVPDFRDVKRFAVDGAEGRLPSVGEKVIYSPNVLSETKYSYAVTKYGRTLHWSWEAFINDDLDALGSSSPARLGKAARRSEDYFATGLHVDSSGPHASLYTSGNKNIINTTNGASSTNPVFGIAGLQDAFTVMGLQLDADSEPIGIDGVILEVPPSLQVAAQNVLNATEIKVGADSGAQQILTSNWMKSKVTLVVNPYIPVIATTNGKTTWFVHASPTAGRPAMEMGLLQGHETPELFMRMQSQVRVGGGGSGFDGSFEDDTIAYKVRHVFGGTRVDGKATVGSNGSGS
jgi:hypothetical protein